MSRGVIITADADNNQYAVSVPGYGNKLPAQCVTEDPLSVGSVIEIADWDNKAPDKMLLFGNLRLLPNVGEYKYSPSWTWSTYEELINAGKPATLSNAFFYSSEWYNPRWQTECPLYRGGQVVSIIDEKYMMVKIWSMPISADSSQITLKCRTDYMTCDTVAFSEDDLVVIKFEGCIECPVVVGFWLNPLPCDYWEPWGDTFCENNTWAWNTKNDSGSHGGSCSDLASASPEVTLSEGVLHCDANAISSNTTFIGGITASSIYTDNIPVGTVKFQVSASTSGSDDQAQAQVYIKDKLNNYHTFLFAKNFESVGPGFSYVGDGYVNIALSSYGFDTSSEIGEMKIWTFASPGAGSGSRAQMDIDWIDFN